MAKLFETYAKIQLSESGNEEVLLESGFIDRSMPKLREHLDIISNNINYFGVNKEFSLTKNEIEFFSENIERFKKLTYKLVELSNIPNTIDHGDFYVANMAIEDQRCVVFDWSDGCVTHPFLSMIPFFGECEFESEVKDELLNNYLKFFSDYDSPKNLLKEYKIVKIIAEMHLAWTYYRITNSLSKELQWETEKSFVSCIRGIIKYFKKGNDFNESFNYFS